MRVLVTGGTGFLGSNIIKSLKKKQGLLVEAPARLELDLNSRESIEAFLRHSKPDVVVHAAAVVGGIGANHGNNFDFLVSNTTIDSNLLGASADLGIDKLVSFGSSCMFPPGTGRAITESEIDANSFEPTNEGYAIAKKHLADMIRFGREEKGLYWTHLVLSNLYGPGDNFDPGSSHLLAAIIEKILSAQAKSDTQIVIWGSGTPRREFTFAEDVSEWLAEFITLDARRWPAILNLGAGEDHSVRELYQYVAKILGWNGSFLTDESKPDGAKDKLMNSSLARQSYSWNPPTNIQTGIRRAIDWRKQCL